MRPQVHSVQQHRTAHVGVEAYSLRTEIAFPRHSHDQFGIGVMVDGAQRSWSCVGQVEAGAGDVIMVNPGEIHDGAPMGERPRSWRMLYFEPRLVAEAAENERTRDIEIIHPAVKDERLARRFARLFRAVTDPHVSVLERDEALLLTLASAAARHVVNAPRKSSTSVCVARARQMLDDAIDANRTLAELAEATGVSRFQLLRSFARDTGATPHAYLLQRRVNAAKRLLAAGMSPAATAHQLGFADQSHLTRAFKRQFGVTPGQYRAALN